MDIPSTVDPPARREHVLVGTTHESGVPIVHPDLDLFASVDGGDSFQDVFQQADRVPGRAISI